MMSDGDSQPSDISVLSLAKRQTLKNVSDVLHYNFESFFNSLHHICRINNTVIIHFFEKEFIMLTNIGATERPIRIALGLLITSLAFWGPATPWAYLGLIFVVTGFMKYCPIWHITGINTNKKIETEKLK